MTPIQILVRLVTLILKIKELLGFSFPLFFSFVFNACYICSSIFSSLTCWNSICLYFVSTKFSPTTHCFFIRSFSALDLLLYTSGCKLIFLCWEKESTLVYLTLLEEQQLFLCLSFGAILFTSKTSFQLLRLTIKIPRVLLTS